MRKQLQRLAYLFVMTIVFFSCQQGEEVEQSLQAEQNKSEQMINTMSQGIIQGMDDHSNQRVSGQEYLRHVILYNFNDNVSEADQDAFIEAISGLAAVSTVTDYEWGNGYGNNNLAKGFTHAFIFTFNDLEGLNTYVTSDLHTQFVGEYFIPMAEDFIGFDYISSGDLNEFSDADFRVLAMHKDGLDAVNTFNEKNFRGEPVTLEGGADVSGGVFTQGYQEAALISFDNKPKVKKVADEDLLVINYKVRK